MASSFVVRKLTLPENLEVVPPIIKVSDFKEIADVNVFVERTRVAVETYQVEQEKQLQARQTELLANLKEEAQKKYNGEVEKIYAAIEKFQRDQQVYFDQIESICTNVVRRALEKILADVSDEEKIMSAVKSVAGAIKDESNVTVRVNPQRHPTISSVAREKGWEVETDPSLDTGECQLDISLGRYISNFNTSVETLMGVFS